MPAGANSFLPIRKLIFKCRTNVLTRLYLTMPLLHPRLLPTPSSAQRALRRIGMALLISTSVLVHTGQAQQYTPAKIDSIHGLGIDAWDGDFEAALRAQFETIKASEQLGYKKGIATGYHRTASAMLAVGKYEEALRYADLAQRERYTATDKRLQARLSNVYGRGYTSLGFYEEALDYFDEGIRLIQENEPESLALLASLFQNKASAYSYKGDFEAEFATLQEQLRIYPDAAGHSRIAVNYLDHRNNPDSALHHLRQANELLQGPNPVFLPARSIVMQNHGYYHERQQAYDSALYYYQKALDFALATNGPTRTRLAYQNLANVYERMGNQDKSREFRTKYLHIDDSLVRARKRALSVPIAQFLREKEQAHALASRRIYLIFGSSLLLAIAGIFWLRHAYLKKKAEREDLLEAQADLIRQGENEAKALEQRVNEAFDEVLQLAEANDPSFLARFQEVYPNFVANLMKTNPKLVNTELTLCAMIFLNLSTKDIARITYVQPKSVQINKYRLRKKLEIPQEDDLHVWMKSLA